MIFNWEPASLTYLTLLLLLCGNISCNPGPVQMVFCGFCSREVVESDATVCCDSCDKWIHISCDSLSIDDYKDMVDNHN